MNKPTRPRVTLFSLFLLVLVVALAITLYRTQLRAQRLANELIERRTDQNDAWPDPARVNVKSLVTQHVALGAKRNRADWKWRVMLPADREFRLRWLASDSTASTKAGDLAELSESAPDSGEMLLAAGASDLSVRLSSEAEQGLTLSIQNEDKKSQAALAEATKLFTYSHLDYKLAGNSGIEMSDPAMPARLVLLREYRKGSPTTPGFLLWIEPVTE